MTEYYLRFLNTSAAVSIADEELAHRISTDFFAFIVTGQPEVNFLFRQVAEIKWPAVDRRRLKSGQELSYFNKMIYVDYHGARVCYDTKASVVAISGDDIHRLHEAFYLSILSLVGKRLDLFGYHKIHAFGVVLKNISIVGIGPSGIGKSTILNEFINHGAKILSDDIPVISRHGLHPFAIRRSTSEKDADVVLRRRLYGLKYLKRVSGSQVAPAMPFRGAYFLILRRREQSQIRKCSRLRLFGAMFKYMVIGVGTPMVIELFWQPGIRDFYCKARIFLSRLAMAWQVSGKVQGYVFDMSGAPPQNAQMLLAKFTEPDPDENRNRS